VRLRHQSFHHGPNSRATGKKNIQQFDKMLKEIFSSPPQETDLQDHHDDIKERRKEHQAKQWIIQENILNQRRQQIMLQ